MTAVDRGTKADRARESLERTRTALERSRGSVTEQDWREALERAEAKVVAELRAEKSKPRGSKENDPRRD